MNKLLIITGPTATGKTKLGVELAEKFNGEIISADSRQVYKYTDIGTGKNKDYFQWGINLVLPDEKFSVSDWVKYANETLKNIWSRNKLPIVVGGTGQYIKELLYPSETLHVPPNKELRSKNYELRELQNWLQKINLEKWESMNGSDRKNPRRLIRAIEISKNKKILEPSRMTIDDYLIIGLTAPQKILNERIDRRVEKRIKLGMAEEKEKLAKMGYFPDAFGYKETSVEEWKNHEHQYAKKQLAYLQKYLPEIKWFDVNGDQSAKISQIFSRWRGNN